MSVDLPGGDGGISINLDGSLSPDEDVLSSRRANALSTKLSSVLSSSYADSEIREALMLYDKRNVGATESVRRNIKADVQKEVIDSNGRVIDDFGQVAAQLKRVGVLLQDLNESCDQLRSHVLAAKQESTPVLEEASVLLVRKEETESRRQLLDALRKHFIVSDADLTILTSSAEPVNEAFFIVLDRVKQIHKDCETLLGNENQRLGLELMEQTTRNLDAGYKKLYNWIQREFKGLDLEDPRISASIRRSLRVLSERPTLFQNCLESLAQARENTLSQAFHAALTGTSTTQAIEFSTHDPLRYIGDMLAWTHSAAVSENEALEGLFVGDAEEITRGLAAGRLNEPWAHVRNANDEPEADGEERPSDPVFDGQKALSELIGRTLTGVCRTLYGRIEIAVRNSGDAVIIYKIYNLLTFYQDMFTKYMKLGSSIGTTIVDLEELTLKAFEETTEEDTAAAVADFHPASDLSPPAHLELALKQFSEIARARGPQMSTPELERVFSALLSGVLNSCAEGAAQISDRQSSNVYKLNYLKTFQNALRNLASSSPSAALPLEKANEEIHNLQDALVNSVTTSLLDASGVSALLLEIDSRKEMDDRRKWLLENLAEFAQQLDDFLSSGLMDTQDSLKNMVDKPMATEIVSAAVQSFCSEFDELESMLEVSEASVDQVADDDEAAEGSLLRHLFPRTGAEVRALLS